MVDSRAAPRQHGSLAAPEQIHERFRRTRRATLDLAAPLSAEDCQVQSFPSASPVKWHLAHTSWFFETFVLERSVPGYRAFHPAFRTLFNSYYVSVGPAWSRMQRGVLTRPALDDIRAYRAHVDAAMLALLERDGGSTESAWLVELGLTHEEQHQELLVTDVKHLLSRNPLFPVYRASIVPEDAAASRLGWLGFDAGLAEIGHAGDAFAFDNETPRHRVYLAGFELASRPATNGEWLAFVEDRGYERAELWLSDGFDAVRAQTWCAPLHWVRVDGAWFEFTLYGLRALDLAAPVAHVSFYESDAFARWSGARLPTEFEWERAARDLPVSGNFAAPDHLHPCAAANSSGVLEQMFGDVWEWTASAYTPYPGFRPWSGDVGEYNGKFMSNQMVLRGGSCATPPSHVRATYRNFFHPDARWQFSGVRLARDSR